MRWAGLLLALLFMVAVTGAGRAERPLVVKTRGRPFAMLVAPDGRHLLVTEDGAGDARSPGAAGLEVFRVEGGRLTSERFIPLPGAPAGIVLAPLSATLAVGLGGSMGLLDLDAVLSGQPEPVVIRFGKQAGPDDLTASPDGRFLFATAELAGEGEAEVIALVPASQDRPISASVRAVISTPWTTPGLALSPDGSRLYVVAEVAPPGLRLSGAGQSELSRRDCRQGDSMPALNNGVLYAFDVAALMRLTGQPSATPHDFAAARLSRSAAGCSPVRLAVSGDGRRVYVTARGQDQVLVFDARKLETDPDHALLHAFPSGGEAPVGMQLVDQDRRLVVANSNRFRAGPGDIAVLDAGTGEILARFKAGTFPRNVASARNGATFVADFGSSAIEVLPPSIGRR